MDDNRYQENAEDQHTLTRPGMVTSPHDASAMPLTLVRVVIVITACGMHACMNIYSYHNFNAIDWL